MNALHYVVSGSVGVEAKTMQPQPVVIDTGSGYSVVRRSALPEGWERYVTTNRDLPTLGALQCRHEVLLRVRFGNALYRVKFLVVDNLACPLLLGTKFTNLHVEAIWCIRGRVQFTQDTLPIIGRGDATEPWSEQKARISERATLETGEQVKVGDETATLTRIRLARRLVIPPQSQAKVEVTTLLQGLIVTEPKHDVSDQYNVRVMNSVHEVIANVPFPILVANFSRQRRVFPKGMVIAYASRSPLALISIDEDEAAKCGMNHLLHVPQKDGQAPEAPVPEEARQCETLAAPSNICWACVWSTATRREDRRRPGPSRCPDL